jgi:hypothetical protein
MSIDHMFPSMFVDLARDNLVHLSGMPHHMFVGSLLHHMIDNLIPMDHPLSYPGWGICNSF